MKELLQETLPHVGHVLRTDSKQNRQLTGDKSQANEQADEPFFLVQVALMECFHQRRVVVGNKLIEFLATVFRCLAPTRGETVQRDDAIGGQHLVFDVPFLRSFPVILIICDAFFQSADFIFGPSVGFKVVHVACIDVVEVAIEPFHLIYIVAAADESCHHQQDNDEEQHRDALILEQERVVGLGFQERIEGGHANIMLV